jgi:hypothetical protein
VVDSGVAFANLALLNGNNALTGNETHTGTEGFSNVLTNSLSPTTSQSAILVSGAPQAGGNATTNFPLLYLNDGTGPSTFSTAGTEFGINAPTGFAGSFIDTHLNGGASLFAVNVTTGGATVINASSNAGAVPLLAIRNTSGNAAAVGNINFGNNTSNSEWSLNVFSSANTSANGFSILGVNVTTGVAGNFTVQAGNATGAGTGGSLVFNAGTTSGGTAGTIAVNSTGSISCASGLQTSSVGVLSCIVSKKLAKNPRGEMTLAEAQHIVAGLLAQRFEYKDQNEYPAGDRFGFYADDICKLDERLCERQADGSVQSYDVRGIIAAQNMVVEDLQRRVH